MNDSWVPEAEAKEQYLNDGLVLRSQLVNTTLYL